METTKVSFDLLWPAGAERTDALRESPQNYLHDLGVERIADAVNVDVSYRSFVGRVLSHLCTDPAVIRYRLDILQDLTTIPTLVSGFKGLVPRIRALRRRTGEHKYVKDGHAFRKVGWRLEVLSEYIECIRALHDVLAKCRRSLTSAGLQRLAELVAQVVQGPEFAGLTRELPGFKEALKNVASVTIGVNLSGDLKPAEAALLSIGPSLP